MLSRYSFPSSVRLDSAGLVALADLKPIAHRTVLTGSASWLDILLLAPGIHIQQDASRLNGGEFPVCGAMTTGYVFRIENQATVKYLQGVGLPGHLTTVKVTRHPNYVPASEEGADFRGESAGETVASDSESTEAPTCSRKTSCSQIESRGGGFEGGTMGPERAGLVVSVLQRLRDKVFRVATFVNDRGKRSVGKTRRVPAFIKESGRLATALYLTGCTLTITVIVLLIILRDWWGFVIVGMLMLARLINVVIVRLRAILGWKGAREPGVQGDMLILLSQDRWIRMQGLVDDLKDVTAGQWLRDLSPVENFFTSVATMLVYVSAALAGNASTTGSLTIAVLLLLSVGLLGLCNACTPGLRMYDRLVCAVGEPKEYGRRREMAEELVKEMKRGEWAIAMGLILSNEDKKAAEEAGQRGVSKSDGGSRKVRKVTT